MKSYTNIEQSRKLAEILPIKSADMCFNISVRKNMPPLMIPYSRFDEFFNISPTPDFLIPCWSLAVLLDILESEIDGEEGETYQLNIEKDGTWWNVWYREQYDGANPIETESTEDLVDACVEMILKLNKLNLLRL